MNPDWILFACAAWDDRWGRSQHLAEHLRRRGRVLYVSPPLSILRRPCLTLRVRRVCDRLTVVDLPGGLPGRNYLPPSWLSQKLWALHLRRCVERRLAADTPVAVLVQTPAVWLTALNLPRDLLIYDAHDLWRSVAGNRRAIVDRAEEAMARRADVVLAASESCRRRFAELGVSTKDLPNACEPDDYLPASRPAPAIDLEPLPRPRFLYYGGIDACLDVEAVRAGAAALPGSAWAFLGPVLDRDVGRALSAMPACHLLGTRPYRLLPAYVAGADALVLPFRLTDWSMGRDCVKLYEYLATGLPAAATALPRAVQLSDVIAVADPAGGPAAFADACRRALADDTPERRAVRLAAGRDNSWARRTAALTDIVAAALAERRRP